MVGPSLPLLLVVLLSLALGSAGQGAQDTGERIINGVPCPRGSQPWQVALFQGSEFECAGVLIHEQWVLTVAHCYRHEYTVQMGSDLLVGGKTQRIRATESFPYPAFRMLKQIHDIMLVKLSSPANLSSTVRKVNLPSHCKPTGANCTISGWGTLTSPTVTNPPELMCSNVSFVSYKDCRKFHKILLKEYIICAAPPDRLSYASKSARLIPVLSPTPNLPSSLSWLSAQSSA
ncbi:kallikrein-7-like [Saccopteryx leptura]|uniref:kallikrein-7-like n=1 Tax=Saccopteryx leptura TaxID=249018 RepID=UPI00339C7636